ncbi:MAG: hypothetical protein WCD48_17710 [Candidatus Sulfotelmatobacter sp.]
MKTRYNLANHANFEMKKKAYWHRLLTQFGSRELSKAQIFWRQRAKRIAINLFLGFHILAITCWCVPLDTPLFSLGKNLVRPYFLWAGLFQSWDMFAPTPALANSYVEAIVVYKDGSRRIWSFPRMEQLSLSDRYFRERYRKFSENLQNDQNDALWPDVARRIARANSTPSNPAKTVILVQRWSPIVPRADGSYQPEPWDQHVLYGYGVKREDLQ